MSMYSAQNAHMATNDTSFTNAIRYDSMFNQWESMSPMPETVLHPAVAATNQRIFVFGGEDAMQNPVRIIQVPGCAPQSLLMFHSFPPLMPHLPSPGVSHCQEHVV